MSLTGLTAAVLAEPVLAQAMVDAKGGVLPTLDLTGPAGVRPFVVAGLVEQERTVLAVTPTSRDAEDLVAALGDLVDPSLIGYYPSWETLPHERLSPRSDTVGRRLAVLRRLRHPGDDASNGPLKVVVAPVRSLLQPQVPGLGDLVPVELTPGTTAPLEDVVQSLADAAYSRVDLVEKRGEFAVRGGIVDVFPPTEEHPLRVEFWGDDVEEIRSFSVSDQRTLEPVPRLWAPPCRELLLTDDVRRRAAELGRAHPQLVELTDKIAAGIAVEGMESLAPVLVDGMELLVDLLPRDSHVVVLDPERARSRAHDLVATSEEFLGASWAAAASGGQSPIDLGAASYRELADVREHVLRAGRAWWSVSPFGIETDAPEVGDTDAVETRVLPARVAEAYRGDLERAITDIRGWLADDHRVVVLHPGHGPAQRMVEVLADHDVPAAMVEPDALEPRPGVVTVSCGALDHGFVDPSTRLDGAHRRRPVRPEVLHPRHAADAGPAQEADRPAGAQGRRLRRPRAARRRPLRRDEAARGRGSGARVPRPRLRRLQAGRPARPAVRAGRRARPGDPVRRRRAAEPRPARRRRLDQAQEPRPQGGPGDRGRADQALRRPAGHPGPRLRPGHPVAARARGRVPVPGDPRPAEHGRRGQGRHAAQRPDGPAGVRRRRLRQDRDRGPRRVQGRAGRQAGRRPGPHDAAGHPAPLDVRRADERLPGHR